MKQSDLQQALRELQQQHVFLRPSGNKIEMWAPGASVSDRLRRVVYKHRREVLLLLDLSEISTCPSPDLHAHSWKWSICRDTCDICARLKPYIGA